VGLLYAPATPARVPAFEKSMTHSPRVSRHLYEGSK